MDARQLKKWPIVMMKRFQSAQKSIVFQIIQADPDELDVYYIMLKPTGGHYRGQTHILELKTKHGKDCLFPFTAPMIKCITKIWHPNIMVTGSICLDILSDKKKWSPQNSIESLISSIILLMDCPENSSPFNSEAAKQFSVCEKKYETLTKGVKMENFDRTRIYDECFKAFDTTAFEFAKSDIDYYIELFDANLVQKMDDMKV